MSTIKIFYFGEFSQKIIALALCIVFTGMLFSCINEHKEDETEDETYCPSCPLPNDEEPEEQEESKEPEKHENLFLLFEKTELGGCNLRNVKSTLKNNDLSVTTGDDVFSIAITKDSIHFFVGFNYQCIDPFETKIEVEDDVVCIYIIDTGKGYYRCKCYYTFDFIFKRKCTESLNQQRYKILLIDPQKNEPIIISEGVMEDDNDNNE